MVTRVDECEEQIFVYSTKDLWKRFNTL
jgi:hypothetical protein